MKFFKKIFKSVGFKKENIQEKILVVVGEEAFLENYNKGFFLVPLSIIDSKKTLNKKFAFNKYRDAYYKINEHYDFEEMSFYVCKNLSELSFLYKIKKAL